MVMILQLVKETFMTSSWMTYEDKYNNSSSTLPKANLWIMMLRGHGGDSSDDAARGQRYRRNNDRKKSFNFKVGILYFDGRNDPNEFIDWLNSVERIFEFQEISEDRKVKFVAIKLKKYASIWVVTFVEEKEEEESYGTSPIYDDSGDNGEITYANHGESLVILLEENENGHVVPSQVQSLLQEFQEVVSPEIPSGLPPIRNIQHYIDLVPDALIPNKATYRMSPNEYKELQRQVEDLLVKGLIRESKSPCVVPSEKCYV
ncbi:hypothetical protein ZIOFF_010169 [Zingiber officinale]|uniref:Uncharacterized protein n=1 Tax=Zingiber officinale TaxID=94328 RepID=A0A8J5LY43_ZINOF|nr:hypothetical protein ZIOFF_010169 [Zingiber officinale]